MTNSIPFLQPFPLCPILEPASSHSGYLKRWIWELNPGSASRSSRRQEGFRALLSTSKLTQNLCCLPHTRCHQNRAVRSGRNAVLMEQLIVQDGTDHAWGMGGGYLIRYRSESWLWMWCPWFWIPRRLDYRIRIIYCRELSSWTNKDGWKPIVWHIPQSWGRGRASAEDHRTLGVILKYWGGRTDSHQGDVDSPKGDVCGFFHDQQVITLRRCLSRMRQKGEEAMITSVG